MNTSIKPFTESDFEELNKEIDNESDYDVLYENADCKMWVKARGEGSQNVIKRHKYRGTFKFSTDLLYATVKDRRARKLWDPRDLGIETIEGPIVTETEKGRINRDFVTVGATKMEVEGGKNKFIMIGRSVDHKSAQPTDAFVRGEINYYGLVLIPTDKPDECIYWSIIEADPKGWIPQSLYNYFVQYGPKEFEDNVTKGALLRIEQKLSDRDCCDEELFV
ncbi:hypothetical protein AKO1_013799 [Acrasis kona]|uniref:START domain-containing protein n=1 Tax=Acrasis kona TaxID=1008807 RepID=A0AAW2ZIS3_9EUKA